MLRLVNRAAPLALVIALGLQGSAVAVTRGVTIADFSFTPRAVGARIGDTVRWTNSSPGTQHTSTHDATDPLVWDSGVIAPGEGTFSFVFRVAGVFTYHCNIHPFMTGSVRVKPTAFPLKGPVGTKFSIRVATVFATGALVYDIQIRAPGGRFVKFVYGNRSGRVVFNSKGHRTGLYQFRARLRNTTTRKVSGFSPAVTISIT